MRLESKVLRIFFVDHIDLIGRNQLRFFEDPRAVSRKFLIDLIKIVNRIASLAAGNIDNVDQDLGSFNMLENLKPMPGAALAPSMIPAISAITS